MSHVDQVIQAVGGCKALAQELARLPQDAQPGFQRPNEAVVTEATKVNMNE